MRFLGMAVVAAVTAAAQSAHADAAFDQCIKGAATSQDQAECGSRWIDREEARLKVVWANVYREMPPKTKPKLLAEQRLWIAFKDQSCRFYSNDAEWGSRGWSDLLPACRARVVANRVRDLQDMLSNVSE